MSDSFVAEISEISLLDYLRLPVEIRREVFIKLAPVHRLAYIDAYCELDIAVMTQGAIMENVISDPLTDILNGQNVRQRKEAQAALISRELTLVRSDTPSTDSNVKPFQGDNNE